MSDQVKPVPDGYHTVTAYLVVNDAAAAIDFYTQVFDAEEIMRMDGPGGKIGHAELQVGSSKIMLADEHPEIDAVGPKTLGGTPVSLMLYVEHVDETFDRAVAAGAVVKKPLADQFYGDRSGMIEDPFGHKWTIATHVEDVSPEELNRRFEEMMQQGSD